MIDYRLFSLRTWIVIRQLSVFILLLSLAGCSFLKVIYDSNQPIIMPLVHPVGPSKRVVLQLTVNGLDQPQMLLCVLELDVAHLAMAGLTNEGLSLFNLSYDGVTLQLDKSPLMPDSIVPEAILADLQLSFWPIEALKKQLPSEWRLDFDKHQRRLYYQDEKIADVKFDLVRSTWVDVVDLVNYQSSYSLHIVTLSYEIVSE